MIDTKELRFAASKSIRDMALLPSEVLELLDRLEAAEKAVTEAYQRGYATGQEEIETERDALRAKIEAAEKDAAHQKALSDSALRVAEGWERKCGELRALVATLRSEISGLHAKIEQTERQKPVAEWGENRPHHYTNCVPDDMLYRLGTPHDACLDGVKGEYEMNNEFIREERYIVFKESDLGNSLKGDEIRQLSREYAEQRRLRGKGPLKCVVVESDWPEYEPTWRAIEARVTGAQNVPDFADAYEGAMEEVAIWKKRALEAEDLNRKFIAEINGPTHMGEPVQNVPSVPDGWQLVPSAESRHPGIYKMLSALHAADNTPGASEWESYQAMLAEAPKPEAKE